jgi:hypothetical protein
MTIGCRPDTTDWTDTYRRCQLKDYRHVDEDRPPVLSVLAEVAAEISA